eukprot:tig00001471_g8876.t1
MLARHLLAAQVARSAARAVEGSAAVRALAAPAPRALPVRRESQLLVRSLLSTAAANESAPAKGVVNTDRVRADGGTRRFFKGVTVEEGAHGEAPSYLVKLDGRSIRTPKKHTLALPTRALAMAIAMEWESQTERVRPVSMPLMSLAATTVDHVAYERERMVMNMIRFLGTDATCVRATGPAELFGVPLSVSHGLFADDHPAELVERVARHLRSLDDWNLAGLEALTAGAKSLVVALAVRAGALGIPEAVAAARVDEEHQLADWGLVEGNHDVDRVDMASRLASAALFLRLLRPL